MPLNHCSGAMINPHYYETDRALSEYLLFHYGAPEEVMPWAFGPRHSPNYPVRCVAECLDLRRLASDARALDLGCAVGRATFELARHCGEVVGVDASRRFIEVARHLQVGGSFAYAFAEEGRLLRGAIAVVPSDIDRGRVRFEVGDAEALPSSLGRFEVVLMANLLDRLRSPGRCLERLPGLVCVGGQLIVTSPYSWLEEYTPVEHWLGGFERNGRGIRTFEELRALLDPDFELTRVGELPFVIREHARKYQWVVAQASTWARR